MTGHDDFDRTLAGWFEADATPPAPADGLDRVIDATRPRRPRPAWLADLGSRWVREAYDAGSSSRIGSLPPFGLRWSTAIVLLLAIAALVGGAMLVGARLVQPSPLPTARLGHLAYGLDGDIYVADWDGRNAIRIADGAPADSQSPCGSFWGEGPIWSPDGRHLAYRTEGNGCIGTVYISDPKGHNVASIPGSGWRVAWSSDSARIATWVDDFQTIGIYGLDGVRLAVLSVPPGCAPPGDFDPIWSPDGTSLMISPCVVPLDGRKPGRVSADDPRSHFQTAYSHDGARMAFVGQGDSVSLVIARTDGTELRVLAGAVNGPNGQPGPGPAYQDPVLSGTGDRVAFLWTPVVFNGLVDPSSNALELRVVDVASGAVTTLASASRDDPLDPITFSPDGDRILFSRTDVKSVTSLWSIRTDGSDAQLLVMGTGWGDWQPLPAGP